MAYTLFIFLPVAVCIFWIVVHSMLASRTETFPEMFCLCLVCGVYLFSDACHATQPQGSPLDTGSLIAALFAGPCIIPLIIMYLQKLLHHRRKHPLALVWILIPSVLFTSGILLYFLNFEERINQAFLFIVGPMLHIVLAAELACLTIYIIRTLRYSRILSGSIFSFILKKRPISLARLQIDTIIVPLSVMVLRIILSDNLYTVKAWGAILSAAVLMISLFVFALNALFGVRSKVSWDDFRYVLRYNYSYNNKVEAVGEMMDKLIEEADDEELRRIQKVIGDNLQNDDWKLGERGGETPGLAGQILNAIKGNWNDQDLISRFQSLMIDKKLFLHSRLTLDEVAEELHSNKTYVSKMVNNVYNMSFPEVVNTLRVDYAEQYLMLHRDAKQEEIATNSGFLSASSFNTTFKKVTGITPKVWLASVDRQNRRR